MLIIFQQMLNNDSNYTECVNTVIQSKPISAKNFQELLIYRKTEKQNELSNQKT